MADKAISELIAASQVTPTDLFVLEQSGTAKKLTGQTLENWLLSFADGHGGIQTIEKVSTSGLKDTYRITLADTTTVDFVVTNGKSISSVKQTSVSGLTRTYTIAFNDDTNQGFTVTDGRSVTNIEKTASVGLMDTYTISYNDGTTSTFAVRNGRGIDSFRKVSTSGLTDTYEILYNDGTSNTFTVTNGAKGDKGDNTFTHIKFASQKPTESSHSMGDIPDNWIGFYWGNSSDAPTDWTQYVWFQIKGEKGDTGVAATLVNSSVEYQVSDSGTITPSGDWSATVPMVDQGKYLWTRTTNTFNTGSPVVSYSVARMGLDGSGSVTSVANISPDENGNVPLTANDVDALPNTGGYLTGGLDMGGHPISGLNMPTEDDQAANMGFVNQQMRKAAPRNLLDNSDFRNPVNQREKPSYSGLGYTIDRWKSAGSLTVDLEDSYITATCTSTSSATGLVQYLENPPVAGTKVTLAMMEANGTLHVGSVGMPSSGYNIAFRTTSGVVGRVVTDRVAIMVPIGGSVDIKWVALYEGEYTAETLPEYQPKGYGAELLECQRYFYKVNTMGAFGYSFSSTNAYIIFITPVEMRVEPQIIHSDVTYNIRIGGTGYTSGVTFNDQVFKNRNQLRVGLDISESGMSGNHSFMYMKSGGTLEFTADLGL